MYANEFINEVMITVFYCKSSVNKFGLLITFEKVVPCQNAQVL